MALTHMRPARLVMSSGSGFAYLMTGIALGCICISGILGSIYTPNMVTGSQHQAIPLGAFVGWIFDLIAIGMVVTTALQGIRARVTERAPWAILGVGAVWIAGMFVAIFAPVWVTGTDPTELPVWAGLSAIVAVILTGILCNFVKTASFQPMEATAGPTTTAPTLAKEPDDDATVKLRRLAQLRDDGAITEGEFQAKKSELLSRI